MKKLLVGAMLALFAVTGAYAAGDTAMTPQQRMKECAPQTKGMTKDQRSAFMSKCLSKSGHDAAMSGKAAAGEAKADTKAKAGKKARKARAKADSAAADAGASADKATAKAKSKAKKKTRKAKKKAADAAAAGAAE